MFLYNLFVLGIIVLIVFVPVLIIGRKTMRSGEKTWVKVRENMHLGAAIPSAIIALYQMHNTREVLVPSIIGAIAIIVITFLCEKGLDLKNQWSWKYPMT